MPAWPKDLASTGITDAIVAGDEKRYQVPPAEYDYVGDGSIEEVLTATRASAAKTGNRNAVLVA